MDKSGPAFPMKAVHYDGRTLMDATGLTKRELFAALAMAGLQANPETLVNARVLAEQAVIYADALLAELAKEEE